MTTRREVHSSITLEVVDPTAFMLAVSTAQGVPLETRGARGRASTAKPVATRELEDLHGTRLQLFETGARHPRRSTTRPRSSDVPRPLPVDPLDAITYLRPSRYVQSDTLQPFARDTFARARGRRARARRRRLGARPAALRARVDARRPGAPSRRSRSAPGVCRDFAHLTAALLRGARRARAARVGLRARSCRPPDFHAVVEALVEGRWVVVDSTRLAPRRGLVRMATGRDATDTAFLTNTLADIHLRDLRVEASSRRPFDDDPDELVELS